MPTAIEYIKQDEPDLEFERLKKCLDTRSKDFFSDLDSDDFYTIFNMGFALGWSDAKKIDVKLAYHDHVKDTFSLDPKPGATKG